MMEIVWIVGSAYCGSSLLNLMLDHLPEAYGLGEASYLWRDRSQDIFCTGCRAPIGSWCPQYAGLAPERFYAGCFERTDASVLVDSSKSIEAFIAKPREPFRTRVIVLSKAPHEAAWSMREHGRFDWWNRNPRHESIADCLQDWAAEYAAALSRIETSFAAEDVLTVTYRELSQSPQVTIDRIADWLSITRATLPQGEAFWRSDSHILGGNPAISSALAGDAAIGCPRAAYLGGKYLNRWPGVRYDDTWTTDRAFVAECQRRWDVVADVCSKLGHDRL